LDRGVDLSFQRVLGVICLDVAEQHWHVNAEVFGLIGDVIGLRHIETTHPQAAEDLLRQQFREARIALLQQDESTQRSERVDSGEAMIAERHIEIFRKANCIMSQIGTFQWCFR